MPDALQWLQCGHIKHMQPRGNSSQQMVSSGCQTEDPVIKGHYTCQGETAAVPYPDRVVPRSAVYAPAMRLIWAMYSVASLAVVKNGAHRYKGAEVAAKPVSITQSTWPHCIGRGKEWSAQVQRC